MENKCNRCDIIIFLDSFSENPYSQKLLDQLMNDGHRIFCVHPECKFKFEVILRYHILYDIYFTRKSEDFSLFLDMETYADSYHMILHKIFFDYDIFDALQIVQCVSWLPLVIQLKSNHGFCLISDIRGQLSHIFQSEKLRKAYYDLTIYSDARIPNSFPMNDNEIDATQFYNEYKLFWESCRNAFSKISIIVLTYNNLPLSRLCIESILKKTAWENYELIIVDNCSTDATREYLQSLNAELPDLKIILNDSNKGFAAGNNIAIKESIGDFIVLLNNDTIVTNGWLTSLVKGFSESAIGMCGPVTNSIGNEGKIPAVYSTQDEMDLFSKLNAFANFNQCYENPRVLALFCTMIKRQVINECGGGWMNDIK